MAAPDSGFQTDVAAAKNFLGPMSEEDMERLQTDLDALFSPKEDPMQVDKELRLKAEEELNESPTAMRDNLEHLKRLVRADDTLMVRTDDAFLAAFLRGRKHDVNKAFQCLKNFYEFKARYPDFYSYLMPSEKPELYDLNHFASLPGLDRKGRKICACVPARIDLEVAPLSDTFKMGTAILELMLNDLHLQVTGTVVIFDLAEFSIIQQARIATPTSAWHLAMIAQDKIPLRVKAVHVLNQPFYFSALYAVFRPFLKKKLRKRIYLHGSDMSSLHKHIAPENLPVEWGGHRESFTAKLTKTLLHLNEHKFKEWSQYCLKGY